VVKKTEQAHRSLKGRVEIPSFCVGVNSQGISTGLIDRLCLLQIALGDYLIISCHLKVKVFFFVQSITMCSYREKGGGRGRGRSSNIKGRGVRTRGRGSLPHHSDDEDEKKVKTTDIDNF